VSGGRLAEIVVISVVSVVLSLGLAATSVGASTAPYPLFSKSDPAVPAACTAKSNSIAPVPIAQVHSLEQSVSELVGTHFQGIGQCGNGLLVLTLTAGSESVAQKVRAKFGPSVQIMVGLTAWNGQVARSPLCGTLPVASATSDGYTSTLQLQTKRVFSGADLVGKVVFRAAANRSVRLTTNSPISVVVTSPGTRRVVGVFAGGVAGTGWAPLLNPGRPQSVTVEGGTARCDGGVGSALPPGRYDAVGLVSGPGITGPIGQSGSASAHFTNAVPIQIVAHPKGS
jgi:hypothetical protein